MEKLKMHSPDLSQENIMKIRDLFPGCVTEARDEVTGAVRLAVDFDQLRQELSGQIVDGPQERYRLDWPGKREALALANMPIAKSLRPNRSESVDFDSTNNLFIEGDNLEALKLLQETYLGQVKMIYIDPPYNTGADFIYEDDFTERNDDFLRRSNQIDDENRMVANTEANGRFHSDWLSMMYSRLRLARNLLRDDGAIFVSIDFNEFSNLKRVMDDIFGEENFQRQIVWRIGWLSGYKTAAANFIRNHDIILFYSKSAEDFKFNKKYIENADFKPLVKKEANITEKMSSLGMSAQHQRELLEFINHENRPDRYPIEDTWNCNEYDDLNSIAIVSFSSEKISKILEIDQDFKGQKSVKMIQRLLTATTSGDDLVLDFFSGTASTAHAILQLNAEDGGNRRNIMVQLPEALAQTSAAYTAGYVTIADLAKERIRRAGKKILDGECNPDWNRDVGFRVLKVDTSNMQDVYYRPDQIDQKDLLTAVDNIKPDRSAEDLLFQVLVDWGVDLTLPIKRETVQGKNVFFVDGNALVACFETGVTEELVKELAGREPLRVVFRDNGFVSDSVKINVEQVFRQISPSTDVKSI